MPENRRYNHIVIFALILLVGLGLAFTLPWLANSQSQAAQSDIELLTSTIYVATTGDGTAPEVGWITAFTNVQDALGAASGGDEIWVAAGVYYPDEGSGQINNAVASTFIMTDGVALYGGFDTSDEFLNDRDWENNLTVLSGDIDWDNGGADVTDPNGVVITTTNIISDNAYHVVTARGVSGTAVLDGFTITAGQADGNGEEEYGGGFLCDGFENKCNPSLSNLTFSGNYAAENGGAMSNYGQDGTSNPILTNVIFSGNSANDSGGAMDNYSYRGTSSPILRDVIFSGNSARKYGGAMYNNGSFLGTTRPNLTNVIFVGNSAGNNGGAMSNEGENEGECSPILTNVTFSGNWADGAGGAVENYASDGTANPILTNVTFSGNLAGREGGAIFNAGQSGGISSPEVRNSILWNNQDSSGTGTISATIYNISATIILTHSLVENSGGSGSWALDPSYVDGGGNIDSDPMFVTPVDPSTAPTTAGNLRLKTGSPAIDAGDNTYIAGFPTDLDGEARIVDGNLDGTPTVDMGAYEYQIEYPYDDYIPLIFR